MLEIEAGDIREPVARLGPIDAEATGQLVAQVRLVDVAGGFGVVVERRVVEPGPATVGSLGRVGDQDVGVELGIPGARGAVNVGGGEEAIAGDDSAPPCPRRVQQASRWR